MRPAERDVDRGHPSRARDRGAKSYLFAFIDDHSRAVMGARWAHHDDVVRMAAAFRPALQARGVPQVGLPGQRLAFVDAWLLRGCAVLGIKLIHSRPGKPEGRGKIERFFRTVREQFLVEVGDGAQVADLAEMNRLFQAWLETAYHRAVHSETGEAPAARWEKATPAERAVPEPGPAAGGVLVVRAAQGRQDGPGPAARQRLPGRRVARGADTSSWCSTRSTWTGSRSASAGSPPGPPSRSSIGRHRHPKTRIPDGQARTEPAPTGIDYLAALGDGHDAALRDQVSYRFLVNGPAGEPGNRGEPEDGEGSEGGGRG